jgi:hypothetical protein
MKATMTKQQAVENVTNSISSIFSREDVINIINRIEEQKNTEILKIIDGLRDDVIGKINRLSAEDIVDFDSAELEMDYHRTVNLQSIDINVDDLSSDLEALFDDFIESLTPEEDTKTENNEQQN